MKYHLPKSCYVYYIYDCRGICLENTVYTVLWQACTVSERDLECMHGVQRMSDIWELLIMTHLNVELAYKRMHEVDIGTYLRGDAAHLFLKCPQPAQGFSCMHARSCKTETYLKRLERQGTSARRSVKVNRGLGQAVGHRNWLSCAVRAYIFPKCSCFCQVAGSNSNPASAYYSVSKFRPNFLLFCQISQLFQFSFYFFQR